LEDAFVFENGGRKLAEMNVGFGDALGGIDDVLFASQFGVGLFEDFQRLVIHRLRDGDDLKHLNCL